MSSKIPACVANSIEGDVIKETKYYKQHLHSVIIRLLWGEKKLIENLRRKSLNNAIEGGVCWKLGLF